MTDISQISFENAAVGDNGEATEESIKPYQNSEPAVASTLNRSPEILRRRVETLRKELNKVRWVQDADRGNFVFEVRNGQVVWESNRLKLENPSFPATPLLYISSFIRTGIAPSYVDSINDDPTDNIKPNQDLYTRWATTQIQGEIRFVSRVTASRGSNDITVKAQLDDSRFSDPSNEKPEIETGGSGSVTDSAHQPSQDNVVIYFHSSHTIDDVVDAFDNANYSQTIPVGVQLLDAYYIGSNSSANMFDFPETQLSGGFDGVRFVLSPSVLDAHFQNSEGLKYWGDTLAINFDSILERRRKSQSENNFGIVESDLVNLSKNPEKSARCIPICTRLQSGSIRFPNGLVLDDGESSEEFDNSVLLRQDLARPVPFIEVPLSGDTDAPGAKRVGVNRSNFNHLSPDGATGSTSKTDVQESLEAIDEVVEQNSNAISSNDGDISTLETTVTGLSSSVSNNSSIANELEDLIQSTVTTTVEARTLHDAFHSAKDGLNTKSFINSDVIDGPLEEKFKAEVDVSKAPFSLGAVLDTEELKGPNGNTKPAMSIESNGVHTHALIAHPGDNPLFRSFTPFDLSTLSPDSNTTVYSSSAPDEVIDSDTSGIVSVFLVRDGSSYSLLAFNTENTNEDDHVLTQGHTINRHPLDVNEPESVATDGFFVWVGYTVTDAEGDPCIDRYILNNFDGQNPDFQINAHSPDGEFSTSGDAFKVTDLKIESGNLYAYGYQEGPDHFAGKFMPSDGTKTFSFTRLNPLGHNGPHEVAISKGRVVVFSGNLEANNDDVFIFASGADLNNQFRLVDSFNLINDSTAIRFFDTAFDLHGSYAIFHEDDSPAESSEPLYLVKIDHSSSEYTVHYTKMTKTHLTESSSYYSNKDGHFGANFEIDGILGYVTRVDDSGGGVRFYMDMVHLGHNVKRFKYVRGDGANDARTPYLKAFEPYH